MLTGYSLPLSPKGTANAVPQPPWYYTGNVLAIEYEADSERIIGYLPAPLKIESNKCCVYFIDWQYASENGNEHLNPVESQYRETIILMSARYNGEPVAYCPYIWVDQDKALIRGLLQGWPKQIGNTHLSKAFALQSKAAPQNIGAATLSVNGKRYIEGCITFESTASGLPSPSFAKSTLIRHFPNLEKSRHHSPLISELVQLKSRNVEIGPIRKGSADLKFLIDACNELSDFKPTAIKCGYQFEVSLVVDDLQPLEKL